MLSPMTTLLLFVFALYRSAVHSESLRSMNRISRSVVFSVFALVLGAGYCRSASALTSVHATPWTNTVDHDSDGFVQKAQLNFNEAVSGAGTFEVGEDVYYRVTGSGTWIYFLSTPAHFISGTTNPNFVTITSGGDHNLYDWRIDIFEVGGPFPIFDGTDDSTTNAVLSAFKIETPAQDDLQPVITSSLSQTAAVGTPFAYQITATNFPNFFNAVVTGRTVLPFGLSIDPSTGIISGTPIEFGKFQITLSAQNANPNGPGTATLTLDIHYPARGAVGLPFYFYFYPTDNTGAGPISSTPLPPGLQLAPLDPAYAQALVGKPVAAAIYGLPSVAGTTSVTFTGQFTTETIVATIDITIDPAPAPSSLITGITISRDPLRVNTSATFTAVSQQLAQGAEAVFIFFQNGQPLPDGVQAPTTFGSGSVSRSFATPGDYTAFAAVFDGFNVGFYTQNFTVEALDPSSAVTSVVSGTVTNPNNGLGISIPASLGGVLDIDIVDSAVSAESAALPGSRDDSVLNEISGRSAVQGLVIGKSRKNFASKFTQKGIYLIQTTVNGRKARRMLPIGAPEVGQPLSVAAPRDDSSGIPGRTSISGKFFLSPAKADQVKLSGQIALPAGIDTTAPQTLDIGVGNVIETVTLNRGTGTSDDGRMKVQLRTSKKSDAKFTITLKSPQLDTLGFDTEGISAHPKSALNIQIAFVVEGVPYFKLVPVSARASSGAKTSVQITAH
jgi:hypothetical protein